MSYNYNKPAEPVIRKILWEELDSSVAIDRKGGLRFLYKTDRTSQAPKCEFSLWSEVGEPYKAGFAGFFNNHTLSPDLVEYDRRPWIANQLVT